MTNHFITARNNFAVGFAEKRITLNGREWGLVKAGEVGPSLLLLPGTLGRADIFWNQIDALKERAQIYALSYPDSGSIELWVEDIIGFLDQEGIQNVTLLGSSLGGYIAQYLTEKHPQRVKALVAANTLNSAALVSNFPPYSLDLDKMPIEDLRKGFTDNMKQNVKANPESRELVELLLGEVEGRISDDELRMRLKALKEGPELAEKFEGVCPVYTVESEDDHLIPEPMRELVRARLSPKKAFRFTVGSHFPYVVRPQEYVALLEEVLGLNNTSNEWPDGTISEQ
ncbi:MAG: alpha/beta hydrolase [Rhizobiaceae bacterium]